MKRSTTFHAILVFAVVAITTACTGRGQQRIDHTQDPNRGDQETPGLGGEESTIEARGEHVDIRYPISGRELQQKYDLDLNSLSYKFTYGEVAEEDDIEFENGEAELEFNDLPVGETHTVWLKIYESDVLKLQAKEENFTLEAGKTNRLALTLKAVNGDGETTDLIVDVKIADGALEEDDADESEDEGGQEEEQGGSQADEDESGDTQEGGDSEDDHSDHDHGGEDDGDDDQSQEEEDQSGGNEDTTQADVTYQDVEPILERCLACHNGSQDPDLSNFPFASGFAASQEQIVRTIIDVTSGPNPSMPLGSVESLSSSEVDKIRAWLDAGLPKS